MPPKPRPGTGLSADDLTALAAALAEGRRATVYLREPTPGLGLPEGASARVVRIDGTTVVVRPRGVDDELPFEVDELRRTRVEKAAPPARKAPAPKPPPAPEPAPRPASAAPVAPVAPAAPVAPVAPVPPAPKKVTRPAAKPAGTVIVTIQSNADHTWSLDVTQGSRRPAKGVVVSPERVERAVDALGNAAAKDAVAGVVSAARRAAAARVEQLSKELEAARNTLKALESPD